MKITTTAGTETDGATDDGTQKVLAMSADQLTRVRSAADKWLAGLAGLVTTATTFFVIKGPGEAEGLATPWKIAVAVGTLLALLALVGATLLASRASYGLPKSRPTPADPRQALTWTQHEAKDSATCLRRAIYAFCGAVVLLAASTAIIWVAPTDTGPVVRIQMADGTAACGPLSSADADRVLLKIGQQTLAFDMKKVTSLTIASNCD